MRAKPTRASHVVKLLGSSSDLRLDAILRRDFSEGDEHFDLDHDRRR
jgi:hypothetical protein